MEEKFSLKDQLYNPNKVAFLSAKVKMAHHDFDHEAFQKEINLQLPDLELKARMHAIAAALKNHLPMDYRTATNIIINALPAPLDETKSDNDFGDFIYAPFAHFVVSNGCNANDLMFSLAALKEITKRFSVEFAIRPFLNHFPDETLKELENWAADKNYHVRRLASEGTRPKLPWAEKINISIEATLPILNLLFSDQTRYVTRSVANHLNDISKINPELVLSLLQQWQEKGIQAGKEMDFIKTHALRSLVKSGHNKTLTYLGFAATNNVVLKNLEHSNSISIGENLAFSFALFAEEDLDLLIDYILYFCNKAGKTSNKKVFKLKKIALKSGIEQRISKKHPFKANMSTRKLYPGLHRIEIQVNGRVVGVGEFVVDS
jgi:3-methyladenine DNA glycosylase AlkC